MLTINEGAGHVLAEDTRTTFAGIDKALGDGAKMFGTLIDTMVGSNMPAGRLQDLYGKAHEAQGHLLDGRRTYLSVMSSLLVIQRHSNVAETDFGCTQPHHFFGPTGEAAVEPMAQAANS